MTKAEISKLIYNLNTFLYLNFKEKETKELALIREALDLLKKKMEGDF